MRSGASSPHGSNTVFRFCGKSRPPSKDFATLIADRMPYGFWLPVGPAERLERLTAARGAAGWARRITWGRLPGTRQTGDAAVTDRTHAWAGIPRQAKGPAARGTVASPS